MRSKAKLNASSLGTFRTLQHLTTQSDPIGASELARLLGAPVSTIYRALSTLEAEGFVVQDSTSKYLLGPSARRIAINFLASVPLRNPSIPYLRQLTTLTSQTSSLWIKIGWYLVQVASVEGKGEIAARQPLGKYSRLEEVEPGIVMLAAGGAELFDAFPFRSESNKARVLRAVRILRKDRFVFSSNSNAICIPVQAPSGLTLAILATEGSAINDALSVKMASSIRRIRTSLEDEIGSQAYLQTDPFSHLPPESARLGELTAR